ncbi:MAG: ribonuclease HI [Halieaceae bacterium]
MKAVELFTDGTCRGNTGTGAWGALLSDADRERELQGAEPDTTNNRMDLRKAIEGMQARP